MLKVLLLCFIWKFYFFRLMLTSIAAFSSSSLFSCIRERLEDSDAPECMKNLPLALITASCMSIAIMGFAGIH